MLMIVLGVTGVICSVLMALELGPGKELAKQLAELVALGRVIRAKLVV